VLFIFWRHSMRQFKLMGTAVVAALLVAACGGGGGDGNQAPAIKFSSMVTFGDSLSDIGTYRVGTVALLKGGRYTINPDDPATSTNWTELLSDQLRLTKPCSAFTGLDGQTISGVVDFAYFPATAHAGCLNYAQGGARVTIPYGPANKNLPAPLGSTTLGQLTVPIVTQIDNHLSAVGGSFSGTELVTVMAGGNDAIVNAATVEGTASAAFAKLNAGTISLAQFNGAIAAAEASSDTAMTLAGDQLVAQVNRLLAAGAKHVLVVNLPDVGITPFGLEAEAAVPGLGANIQLGAQHFNQKLTAAFSGNPNVVVVDAYSDSHNQSVNPASYALTDVKQTACNLTKPSPNLLGSSLVCNSTNLNSGDVSHYMFADTVHPTPYGYKLLAQLVTKGLVLAGWL
jgi:outer membrane lipase/esterase